MSETDLGATLTPAEESYFESGGEAEIPAPEPGPPDGEPAAEPAAPKPEGDKAERVVPLAALHEERSRRKEIDRQNRELQQQVAEMRGKFAVIDRLTAPPPVREPTIDTDIFGVVQNTTSTVQQLQRRLDERDAAERANRERDSLIRAYQADAAQFESRTPDFKAAYNHLLTSRAQELAALGYDDPQVMHQALIADEFAVAQMALASRRSPAEMIYNLAQQRGYVKGHAGQGAAAGKLDAITRGQQANKSLASAGGGSGDGEMSAEALLKMPMDEFEAWCTKHPARAKRIMGG